MVSQLTNLLIACKHLVDDNGEHPHLLYDQSTCMEFHQLLVITPLAYGKALDALEAAKTGKWNDVDLAQRVWFCATLLWRIAYSGVLHYHLHVLYSNLWLKAPINFQNQTKKYQQLTIFHHRDCQMPDANDKEGEEFGSLEDVRVDKLIKLLRGWLCLMVNHWEALSILAKYAPCSESSLCITLLTVKKLKNNTCSRKVDDWKSTIRTFIEQCCLVLTNSKLINFDTVVEYLMKKISRARKLEHHHSIYNTVSLAMTIFHGRAMCTARLY
jgi:hypothetical protein